MLWAERREGQSHVDLFVLSPSYAAVEIKQLWCASTDYIERRVRRVSQSGMEPNQVTEKIIGAACKVHTVLGPGLLEKPYKQCLKHELLKMGLKVFYEVALALVYDGVTIDIGYRIDLLVQDTIIVELKAVEKVKAIHEVQLLTYLRLSNRRLGLLLNFNVQCLKHGIFRVINSDKGCACSPSFCVLCVQ